MKNAKPIWVAASIFVLLVLATPIAQPAAPGMSPDAAEAKARETEAKMTDDERFGSLRT
jgi:hypothetical protein